MLKTETLELTEQWDKTCPQSDKVGHKKVTFVNRYGITLAADMYTPKNAEGRLPALAVSGPFGRGQGAVLRPVRADDGRARLPDDSVRPVLHRRERRSAQIHGLAGHKHRGFHGRGRIFSRLRITSMPIGSV